MPADGSFNEEVAYRAISHRVALLRFEAGTTRRILVAFDAALADVLRETERVVKGIDAGTITDVRRLERLRELAGELRDGVQQLNTALTSQVGGALTEAAQAERAAMGAIFRGVGAGFAQVPDAAVALAVTEPIGGVIYATRIARDLAALEVEIQTAVAAGLARGSSMPNVARMLRLIPGLTETYRGRMVAIARTEVQRVANSVALQTYLGNADLLNGVQYLATLDSRTCVVCAPRHDVVYTVEEVRTGGKDFRRPPLHPRCRCFLAPVTKSWQQLGIAPDPRRDGKPAPDTSFASWLRRQDADTQREFFGGDRRRALWRAGVPLDRFADRGRALRVGELQALAARYAT